MTTTPIKYIGSKANLSRLLVPFIPKHNIYVEAFGGSSSVLFNKSPSKVEIYNDLDSDLYELFAVLRDPELFQQLKNRLDFTLYSREDYEKQVEILRKKTYNGMIEHAMAIFICYNMTTNGISPYKQKAFAAGKAYATNEFSLRVLHLDDIHNRLRYVVIENMDYRKLLSKYDSEDTFFYLDPPYVLSKRDGGKKYTHEMSDEDHDALVMSITRVKGSIFLSGYENKIYDGLIKHGWGKAKFEVKDSSSIPTEHKAMERTEVIWYKPKEIMLDYSNSQRQLSLFNTKRNKIVEEQS